MTYLNVSKDPPDIEVTCFYRAPPPPPPPPQPICRKESVNETTPTSPVNQLFLTRPLSEFAGAEPPGSAARQPRALLCDCEGAQALEAQQRQELRCKCSATPTKHTVPYDNYTLKAKTLCHLL